MKKRRTVVMSVRAFLTTETARELTDPPPLSISQGQNATTNAAIASPAFPKEPYNTFVLVVRQRASIIPLLVELSDAPPSLQ